MYVVTDLELYQVSVFDAPSFFVCLDSGDDLDGPRGEVTPRASTCWASEMLRGTDLTDGDNNAENVPQMYYYNILRFSYHKKAFDPLCIGPK